MDALTRHVEMKLKSGPTLTFPPAGRAMAMTADGRRTLRPLRPQVSCAPYRHQCGSGYRSSHCWISECDSVRAWLGSLGGVVGNGRIRPKSSSWICAACSRSGPAEGRARSSSNNNNHALCRGIPWGVRLVSVWCVGGEIAWCIPLPLLVPSGIL